MHTFPATLPFRIGQEAAQHFGVQITLALEVAVESPVSETSPSHDLADRDTVKAVPVEQPARTLDDGFSYFRTMCGRVRHVFPPVHNIMLIIFLCSASM
jgi:hypothetical protein